MLFQLDLTQRGKTVVCTIHQPSSETFAMFDRLVLLAEGRIAYQGSSSGALSFFERYAQSNIVIRWMSVKFELTVLFDTLIDSVWVIHVLLPTIRQISTSKHWLLFPGWRTRAVRLCEPFAIGLLLPQQPNKSIYLSNTRLALVKICSNYQPKTATSLSAC